MRGQIAIRVEPALLRSEIETGNAETIDRVLLARGQRPLQVDEALARDELGADLGRRLVRQYRGELTGSLVDILTGREQCLRIDEKRRLRKHRRQQLAVAIDDVGAGRRWRRDRRDAADM